MRTKSKHPAVYDPVLAKAAGNKPRYRATCPECDFYSVRSKAEAAEHAVSLHYNYTHFSAKDLP